MARQADTAPLGMRLSLAFVAVALCSAAGFSYLKNASAGAGMTMAAEA